MTKVCQTNIYDIVKIKLQYLKELGDEYWSFKTAYKRDHSHNYFKYPAMMVPQMVRKILDELCNIDPNIQHIYDPFVGSGTTLTESILRGLEFTGRDINPLSILLCKVKSGPFDAELLSSQIDQLLNSINHDTLCTVEMSFKNMDKWFRNDVKVLLSKIRRSVLEEKTLWIRRFFWVALAETVRQVSNSRTTTYKLHIREQTQIKSRNIDVIKIFATVLKDNFRNFSETREHLTQNNLLESSTYLNNINLILGDAREKLKIKSKYNLVLTSPPYGDNQTTVTYGQYSYLPLQWINLQDIDENISFDYLKTITAIDSMSLGGKRLNVKTSENFLLNISPTYTEYYSLLKDKPKHFLDKITMFFYDLYLCLDPMLEKLNSNGYLILTLGNRTVAGLQIELDKVLIEFLTSKNMRLIDIIYRPIPTKRMASKNKSSKTMTKESIVIFMK